MQPISSINVQKSSLRCREGMHSFSRLLKMVIGGERGDFSFDLWPGEVWNLQNSAYFQTTEINALGDNGSSGNWT